MVEYLFGFLIALALVLGPWICILILFQRVRSLEMALAMLRRIPASQQEPQSKPTTESTPAPETKPAVELPPIPPPSRAPYPVPEPAKRSVPPSPSRSRAEWELMIGGKLLNRIGAAAIILAVVFFLKYAFDNDMIPPVARVLVGFVAGSALLVFAARTMRKGLDVFAQGVAGAGIVVLYLSAYSTWGFYDLLPHPIAFLVMCAVTVVAVWRATVHNAISVAILATVGGLTTPMWLATGTMNTVGLWTYLVLLSVGIHGISLWRTQWLTVSTIMSAGTAIWWILWMVEADVEIDGIAGSLFVLLALAVPVVANHLRRLVERTEEYLIVVTTYVLGATSVFATWYALHHEEDWLRMLLFAAAAALYGVFAVLRGQRENEKYIAGTLATFAIVSLWTSGLVPSNGHIGILVCAATCVGALYVFRGCCLPVSLHAVRVFALATAALFLVRTDEYGGLVFGLNMWSVVSMRTLVYSAVCAVTLAAWWRQRDMRIVGWLAVYLWVFIEAHDLAVWLITATHYHESYASMLIAVVSVSAAYCMMWLTARRDEVRELIYAGNIAAVVATIVWCAMALVFVNNTDYTTFFNVRMGTGIVLALSWMIPVLRTRADVHTVVRTISAVGLVLATFELASTESIWWLVTQLPDVGPEMKEILQDRIQLILSGVWIVYAAIVMAVGFARRIRSVRIGGIALLGLAVLKVFLWDLSYLGQPYRIVSFIALGAILLGASFVYTRFRDRIV